MQKTMIALALGAVALVAGAALFLATGPGPDAGKPLSPAAVEIGDTELGGPFTLTNQDGERVTAAEVIDGPTLIYFGYTFCPDVCPTTLMLVAESLERLGDAADRVQPIFISVDPERDTPELLGAYTAVFDERIVGLTGTPQQIDAVTDAYGAHYRARRDEASDGRYQVDHSIYLYIMDPDGAFVRAMDFHSSGEEIADTLRQMIGRR